MADGGEAATAHVLRRTTFGPFPGQVERMLDEHGTPGAVLEAALAAQPVPYDPPPKIDEPFDPEDRTLVNEELIAHWLERMSSDDAWLHEKLMWFWHSHFATGIDKATAVYCWRQLRTFHREALGNFADLTRAMVTDAALLQYLDGDGNQASDPNENFGRELMELHTMGRGHYTQADVRAAAQALSGWSVVHERNGPTFSEGIALTSPVTFLGRPDVLRADDVADQLMAQEATAPFITRKLATFLLGADVASDDDIAAWARSFRSSGYEIGPLVEQILQSERFAASRHARARNGIEWICTLRRVIDSTDMEIWDLSGFAQIPYAPYNVAGWPDRWTSMSSLFARVAYLERVEIRDDLLEGAGGDRADAALARAGLFEVHEETRAALRAMDQRGASGSDLVRGALATPEFALS